MPSFGGLAPFPFRFGGGKPALEHHVRSLASQLGRAYDTIDTNGLVYVRIQAYARVIWDLWEQNARLGYQWDPRRMTDFLSRWEKILAIPVSPSDSKSTRRVRVGALLSLVGDASWASVYSICSAYLGSAFVNIAVVSSATANMWTPTGWPIGQHATVAGEPTWSSNVGHLAILTTQPSTMDDAEFYGLWASTASVLDSALPSEVTFDFILDGTHGAGFYLDEVKNLDNQRFD